MANNGQSTPPIILSDRTTRRFFELDQIGVGLFQEDIHPHTPCSFEPHQLSLLDPSDEQEVVSRFTLRTLSQLSALPPMSWRIKKILPKSGLAAIYGASMTGKTFFVIDLLARVSLGMDFYGRKTTPCPVIYVCLEGISGVSQRMKAWEKHHGVSIPNNFRVITDPFSLMNQDETGLASTIEQEGLSAGVIVIDTLNQSAPTADENSSGDMGTIITNAMKLQRKTNALVILVHHTGKDATRGPRGHSSLFAALDTSIETKRTNTGREWALTKAKDAEDSTKQEFLLQQIELGVDTDGERITSCVALPNTSAIFKLPPPKGKNQITALNTLKDYKKNCGVSLTIENSLEQVKAILNCANKAARAKEAIDGLIGSGHLELEGEVVTIAARA